MRIQHFLNCGAIVLLFLFLGKEAAAQLPEVPTGELGVDYNVTDAKGKRQGRWMRVYQDGSIYYIGDFKNGEPTQTFWYFHENGKVMTIHKFRENARGVVDGEIFNKEGKLISYGKYLNQKKDSVWNFTDPDGILIKKETYKTDLLHGPSTAFYKNGQVLREDNYVDSLAHGPFVEYFDNGKKKRVGQYVAGKLEGDFTYYRESGQILSEGKFGDDYRVGQWIEYNSDGNVKMVSKYEGGRKTKEVFYNGEFTDKYGSGVPKYLYTYKDRKKHGPFEEFYDMGEFIKEEVPEDPRYGGGTKQVERLIGTQVKVQGEYRNDQLDGEITYFDERGQITKTEIYESGKLLETIEE